MGSDLALFVDDNGGAVGKPLVGDKDTEILSNLSMWPKIGQEVEVIVLTLGEGALREKGINRHTKKLHIAVGKNTEVIPNLTELTCADSTESEREEDKNNRFDAAERRESDRFSELILESKVRCQGANFNHAISAFRDEREVSIFVQ